VVALSMRAEAASAGWVASWSALVASVPRLKVVSAILKDVCATLS
jgi:hypothetical protein